MIVALQIHRRTLSPLSAGVVLALAAAVLPAGLRLQAQTSPPPPPPPRVFTACYVPVVGAVYRIKEPGLLQNCLHGHVKFGWTDGIAGGDHGALTGLLDDDHPQYFRTDGTRALTGDLNAADKKVTHLGAASVAGDAVRFEQAVKSGDAAGGDLSGTFPNASVAKLQGVDLAATTPTNGQVLSFNGTAWVPSTVGSGGVTDHGALTGLADDDHPQYLLADGVRATTNGFAVTGGGGPIPTSGQGTRLMWHATKAAFRAGFVIGTQWDDVNVGSFSAALGSNTVASGLFSAALGVGTTAGGLAASAMGSQTIASGDFSLATGLSTTASGAGSTAMGDLASTNGQRGAFVFGDMSTDGTTNAVVTAGAQNEFVVRASGGFRLRTASDLSTGCDLPAGSGVFSCTSSRRAKEHFASLDPETVLGKLAGLSIQSWNYKAEGSHARHAGPTAEDFYSAFKLGTDSTAIGTIDEAGITMVAIQALEARTTTLTHENEALKAALAKLEGLVRQLSGARRGIDQ